MKLINAPEIWPMPDENPRLFLAGSIEMGKAEDWQSKVVYAMKKSDVTILNPRRPDWNSTWKQDPDFKPFRDQVEWEQLAIASSHIILFYFAPGTQSPISLLELGQCINRWWDSKLVVCCPRDFHRYGNVAITCELHKERVYETLNDAITMVQYHVEAFKKERDANRATTT